MRSDFRPDGFSRKTPSATIAGTTVYRPSYRRGVGVENEPREKRVFNENYITVELILCLRLREEL